MNSRDYWAKREDEALKNYQKEEAAYNKEIQRIYQDQLDAIQTQIDAFYSRYADKEGITIADAKKRISKLDIEAYERKAAKYVKEKNFSQKANEEMRLYNATMKINRLEMLKANIGLETIAGADELEKYMAGILKGRTMDELKRQAGILGKTVLNNAEKANSIVNSSFRNANFSDRIWMHQDLLKSELSKLLQTGLIQGKNPRALARELKKTFNASTYNAERLMRTEMARVQTDAQKKSLERNGFEYYEFIANSGCCDICQGLDGKHFKVEKMMPGENAAPMHPHCRCSAAAYQDEEEFNAWLDYLDKGGTSDDWNNHGKSEWKNSQKALEKPGKSSKIKLQDTIIHRSVGAKSLNYDIEDPATNEIFHFAEGTRIQNSQVFAGKGTRKPLDDGVPEGLAEQVGGKAENWQHCKGDGVIDYYGEERAAEVHWFQEESVGKVKFKVKRWKDES